MFEGIFENGQGSSIGKLTYLSTMAMYIGELQVEGEMIGQEELVR